MRCGVVSLRTGIVMARDAGALPMMALPFRFGFGGRMGSGRQWVPWIQIDDAVGLIRRVLQDDALHGAVNAVAPHPVRNAELTTRDRPDLAPTEPAAGARVRVANCARQPQRRVAR